MKDNLNTYDISPENNIQECKTSKIREKRPFFKSIRAYFREYCNCTGVHGFRYFGEKRTIFERVWWAIIFVITSGAFYYCINQVYQKWDTSPVIVSFATKETPIFQIPFPAVTICPEAKSDPKIFNFTGTFRRMAKDSKLNETEQRHWDVVGMVCDRRPTQMTFSKDEYIDEDFYETLKEVEPTFKTFSCKYMGAVYDCNTLFKPILTDEGICYTFNMLDRSEIFSPIVHNYGDFFLVNKFTNNNWSIEHGYSERAGINAYPRRALLSGAKNALVVNLLAEDSLSDPICKESVQGFRVMLHSAIRIPRPSQQYFRVPLDQMVMGSIQPVIITTSDAVKMYNPRKRGCYFPSERKLKYYRIYSQINCRMECVTNRTLHECGCVAFYMPRENDTYICGHGSRECMQFASKSVSYGPLSKLLDRGNMTKPKKAFPKTSECDCLPICSDLTYDVETSQSDWDWTGLFSSDKISLKSSFHLSRLTLFFKSSQFITSQRNELYGPTDFLANFGGLLGLFSGFSVLSLMEIIYFLTVRMICNCKLYGYWAGKDL